MSLQWYCESRLEFQESSDLSPLVILSCLSSDLMKQVGGGFVDFFPLKNNNEVRITVVLGKATFSNFGYTCKQNP